MADPASADLRRTFAELLLALADDKLMLGHRNSDWTGLGPILEEDIAFSSIAQDEIAHAAALYAVIGPMLGRTADELAFGRSPVEYRCASIVEVADDFDWAIALARQLYCDHFDRLRLGRLSESSDREVSTLCRRLLAEEQVHVEHADGWLQRLGTGTGDSRERMQSALDALAPAAAMLTEPVEGQERLEAAGLYPALPEGEIFDVWAAELTACIEGADLTIALQRREPSARGGRRGMHGEQLAEVLEEMTEVYRTEPGAAW